ncbi:MAG: F0F1 ATP synthase subunit delta [Pseudomonadota bacterium]
MMLSHRDRPLTGWSDRYVKAHMDLLTKDEVEKWVVVIDEFGTLLMAYIKTPVFIGGSIAQQKQLLDEFCVLWNLPYGLGLIQLLHTYQHLSNFNIFVDAWKAFYYKTARFFHVHIITASLLTTADCNQVLMAFSMNPEKCRVTQKIEPHIIGGLIVECNGIRFDTSILKQLKAIQRNLSE